MDAGQLESSEARLQDAERCLDRSTDESLPGMIAMARAYNAQIQGNNSAAVNYARLALEQLSSDDFFRRAQAP